MNLSKIKDEHLKKNQSYEKMYGYTYDEITSYYGELIKQADGDPQRIADVHMMKQFSYLFETPFYDYANKRTLNKLINNYVLQEPKVYKNSFKALDFSEKEVDSEKDEELAERFHYIEKHYKELDKRCTDWIVRQKEFVRRLQWAVIKLMESDYILTTEEIYEIKDNMKRAEARYIESQLDVMTMKATEELTPMFEIRLFLNKHSEDVESLMDQWNKHEKIYREKNNGSIGHFNTKYLNFSDKLFRNKYKLLKEDFYKNIVGYGALFLDYKTVRRELFEMSDEI